MACLAQRLQVALVIRSAFRFRSDVIDEGGVGLVAYHGQPPFAQALLAYSVIPAKDDFAQPVPLAPVAALMTSAPAPVGERPGSGTFVRVAVPAAIADKLAAS